MHNNDNFLFLVLRLKTLFIVLHVQHAEGFIDRFHFFSAALSYPILMSFLLSILLVLKGFIGPEYVFPLRSLLLLPPTPYTYWTHNAMLGKGGEEPRRASPSSSSASVSPLLCHQSPSSIFNHQSPSLQITVYSLHSSVVDQ